MIDLFVGRDDLRKSRPLFRTLLDETVSAFAMSEVSADKGYHRKDFVEMAEAHGAALYTPMKSTTTGDGPPPWRRLYHLFMSNPEEFLKHYHRRSNVESVFHMIKMK